MVVMTAKVDFKKILLIIGIAALILIVGIYLLGGSKQTIAPADQKVTDNDARVKFLQRASAGRLFPLPRNPARC